MSGGAMYAYSPETDFLYPLLELCMWLAVAGYLAFVAGSRVLVYAVEAYRHYQWAARNGTKTSTKDTAARVMVEKWMSLEAPEVDPSRHKSVMAYLDHCYTMHMNATVKKYTEPSGPPVELGSEVDMWAVAFMRAARMACGPFLESLWRLVNVHEALVYAVVLAFNVCVILLSSRESPFSYAETLLAVIDLPLATYIISTNGSNGRSNGRRLVGQGVSKLWILAVLLHAVSRIAHSIGYKVLSWMLCAVAATYFVLFNAKVVASSMCVRLSGHRTSLAEYWVVMVPLTCKASYLLVTVCNGLSFIAHTALGSRVANADLWGAWVGYLVLWYFGVGSAGMNDDEITALGCLYALCLQTTTVRGVLPAAVLAAVIAAGPMKRYSWAIPRARRIINKATLGSLTSWLSSLIPTTTPPTTTSSTSKPSYSSYTSSWSLMRRVLTLPVLVMGLLSPDSTNININTKAGSSDVVAVGVSLDARGNRKETSIFDKRFC